MQRLEVSDAVRHICESLGVKRLNNEATVISLLLLTLSTLLYCNITVDIVIYYQLLWPPRATTKIFLAAPRHRLAVPVG